jgi:serine/threonine protein kinase
LLHQEVGVVHCDVKSANVLLDRGVVGRIGDFGIARCLRGRVGGDTVGATHFQTAHVMGTQCYMPPEYLRDGQLSRKVDTYAFGVVVLEALTAYKAQAPTADFPTLVSMFEDCFDSVEALEEHLDRKVDWRPHAKERVPVLHSIAERCLEYKHKRRPDLVDLLPELARVKSGAATPPAAEVCVSAEARECLICLREDSEISGWIMLRPCGHVVCRECGVGLTMCPKCRVPVQECFDVFLP